jgi:hypothetical protein
MTKPQKLECGTRDEWRWLVNRIPKYIRGGEQERPEQIRVSDEIMKFLIKRETSLADALDALTMVMLNALGAKYGQRDEFSHFFEQASRFLGSTERDRAIGLIHRDSEGAVKVQPRTVTLVGERPERTRRLAIEVGEVMAKCVPKSLPDGLDALTATMLTAIEASCGRERADEFDSLMRGFSTEMNRFAAGRVQ